MSKKMEMSIAERDDLISILKARFEKHMERHQDVVWAKVQARLEAAPSQKLWALGQMEETDGQPDVVAFDDRIGEVTFFDCSPESPKGRRSLCFDAEALESRKEHKPKDSAIGMAAGMGIELLTEEEYRQLQTLGEFDLKTSSWIQTPPDIRSRGGALFCDRRFGHVFTYHNGAESYYGARAFRGSIRV